MIIHDREAHAHVLEELTGMGKGERKGVIHCFSGDLELAEAFIALGYLISIPGTVTYKNARLVHEVASSIPLRHMLIETDAPFLTPVPRRGSRNEPAFVALTALEIARRRNIDDRGGGRTDDRKRANPVRAAVAARTVTRGSPCQWSIPSIMTPEVISAHRPLVLASASPRRKRLLDQLCLPCVTDPGNVREDHPGGTPSRMARELSVLKASQVRPRWKHSWVLAADTIVVCRDAILGKPVDADDAARMLRLLSGTHHRVITGFCLIAPGGATAHAEAVSTRVVFKDLGDEEIAAYVSTGEPFGKAGGYGIQGIGAFMVEAISGSYTNVVGLPLCALVKALLSTGALDRFPPDEPSDGTQ